MRKTFGLLAACVILTGSAFAWSVDWPRFLGQDGHASSSETGLLRSWPEGGPKLLWKVTFGTHYAGGRGWGSPTVAGGRVFLLGIGGDGKGRTVWCLDALTGKTVWEFSYTPRGKTKVTGPAWGYCPRAGVTVTRDRVYTIDEIGELFCLDRASGREVWTVNMQDAYTPSDYDWKGWCASPLVVDDRVILPVARSYSPKGGLEGRWVARDVDSGKPVWDVREPATLKNQHIGGGGLYQTPAPAAFAGETCVVASGPSTIVAIRVADGKTVWRHPVPPYITVISTPTVVDDKVLVWGNTTGICVKVDRKNVPHESVTLWEKANTPGSYAFNVPRSGCVYGWVGTDAKSPTGPYVLQCVELATGKVAWETDRENPCKIGVSLMLADGLLFARTAGKLMLVDADPEAFRLKGEVTLAEKTGLANAGWVMPVLSDGRLYVRTEHELLCYQAAEKLPE